MSKEMYDECKEQGILGLARKIPLRSEGLFCKELVLRGEIEWVMGLGGVA